MNGLDPFLVLFVGVEVLGAVLLVDLWRQSGTVIPREDPRRIFRLVKREDRAAYVRIMRRTFAVQMRDASRSIDAFGRQIGKALLPAIQGLADALEKAFRQ